jgi:hypothetical protein
LQAVTGTGLQTAVHSAALPSNTCGMQASSDVHDVGHVVPSQASPISRMPLPHLGALMDDAVTAAPPAPAVGIDCMSMAEGPD